MEALKSVASKRYDPVKKVWLYPIDDLETVEKRLRALKTVEVEIERLPAGVAKVGECELQRNIQTKKICSIFCKIRLRRNAHI